MIFLVDTNDVSYFLIRKVLEQFRDRQEIGPCLKTLL